MTCTASSANLANNRQDHVFRRDPGNQCAINGDPHVFRWLLNQGLRGQHMFNLGCTNAKGQCAECTMCCGMRVTTHNRHPRQGKPLFRANHMHNTLPLVIHGKIRHAKFSGIFFQRFDLNAAFFIGDTSRAICCRDIMVSHRQRAVRCAHRAGGVAQTLKCLRAGNLMHQMAVDINQAGAIILAMHNMRIPNLVK